MNDLKENLYTAERSVAFYRRLINENMEISAKAKAKFDAARKEYNEQLQQLDRAPEKLSQWQIRVRECQKEIESARKPISRKSEFMSLVEKMMALLEKN